MPRNYRAQRDERRREIQFRNYLDSFTFRFCYFDVNPIEYCKTFLIRHIPYYLYIEACIAYSQVSIIWLWPMRFFVLLLYVNFAVGYYGGKANFFLYPIAFFAVTFFLSVGIAIPHILSFFFPEYFERDPFISCCPFGCLDIVMVSLLCRAFWLVFSEYRTFLLSRSIWEEFLPQDIHIPG